MKRATIIYFVDGPSASAEDMYQASKLAADVKFRNARVISEGDPVERCDGVMGCIPPQYEFLPHAHDAIEAIAAKIKALRDATGDSLSPRPPTAAKKAKKVWKGNDE